MYVKVLHVVKNQYLCLLELTVNKSFQKTYKAPKKKQEKKKTPKTVCISSWMKISWEY